MTLSEIIQRSNSIVAFTGAGMSTESGVPDYRSPGGIWSQAAPITYQEFCSSEDARLEDWRRRFVMNAQFAAASPHKGYEALAKLWARGKLKAVITQNIDGMHARSGLPASAVIELHGNATYGACLSCEQTMSLEDVRTHIDKIGRSPTCAECGGLVKAAVISFGQQLRRDSLQRAADHLASSDLVLVLGTSLVVEPAASLPLIAIEAGARLVIVNDDRTPLDKFASIVVRQKIGTTLQHALEDFEVEMTEATEAIPPRS